MSLPTTIAPAILDTIIGCLALLFHSAAAGDMPAAREAARQMLAAYSAETPDELTLAAEIISLQIHTLETLGYASDPELSLNKILRLRSGAVSLSRESHKARRKLDQLQRARRGGIPALPAEAEATAAAPPPAADKKNQPDQVQAARDSIRIAKQTAGANWLNALQKRQAADRITENLRNNQARHTNSTAQAAAPTA